MKTKKLPQKIQDWVNARKKLHLSHAHIQMARELGMNPNKLGKLANHKQEPWKGPLPNFIETLYQKSFRKTRPIEVKTIEELFKSRQEKDAKKKAAKTANKQATIL